MNKINEQELKKQKYRVQPYCTGLEWAEVYALDEDDAINIIHNDKEYEYLMEYEELEAYSVMPTFEELVEHFYKHMPMDTPPSKSYIDNFILDANRIFYQQYLVKEEPKINVKENDMKIEIWKNEYEALLDDRARLQALENGGVDNWEFYDDALSEYIEEKEKEKVLDDLVYNILEACSENVDIDPAGPGTGVALMVDSNDIKNMIKSYINGNK